LYAVICGLLAIPILFVEVPPLYDYANHLARMHILAHYGDSAQLRANYAISWKPSPYLGMDIVVPFLARYMSIYTAGRVFLVGCVVLIVAGAAAVHAALYRKLSPWPAASSLFVYSLIFNQGFANYLLGVGVWLCAFACWIVLSRRAIWARLLGGSILAMLVFFTHFLAFLGYAMCVAAYEFGDWLTGRSRNTAALLVRGVIAGLPFMALLGLFLSQTSGDFGGGSFYGTGAEKLVAALSPFIFPSGRFDLAVLAVSLAPMARDGVFGRPAIALPMSVVLATLVIVAIATPNVLSGVWEMDVRLPLVIVILTVCGVDWRHTPRKAGQLAAVALIGLLALNMAIIAWTWLPIARQFDEFRSAMSSIPRGARVLAFRAIEGTDPKLQPGPLTSYSNLPALAIVERDVFLPNLFKNPMMTVQAAPRLKNIDTTTHELITVPELIAAADPVKGPPMLGQRNIMGQRNYWGGWPQNFDYVIGLTFGARLALPPQLQIVKRGDFFSIYRVVRPPANESAR
jgi:hypothetical protein